MAICDLTTMPAAVPAADALHQLKDLINRDPVFATALRATHSTGEAARLVAEHGVAVTQESLWRNRGTLVRGGLPTWRG